MEAQQVRHLSFMSTMSWIFVFFFLSVCSGMNKPTLSLQSTVFVAFTGETLTIDCELKMPANQSKDMLTCSDPLNREIYSCEIAETNQPKVDNLILELKNLTSSGEYSCQYKKAKVFWFLRVRSEGYKDRTMLDYSEFIIVSVFTGVLLIFSVVGSVCVFRGCGRDSNAECCSTGGKRKQNRTVSEERQREGDNVDEITAPSTSFYASLEPRPRSIYDELDYSATNREPVQSKAKPKKKEPEQSRTQTTQDQQEGVFESVYENF
ncbi:uncharacterized protein si:ch211-243a20.4 [Centropristis striata]|uniref:uncharacterized protein si:ch211-243a20.4 n=1 Tax=Centropristis striata TaxID=184440 RepID=UPI0027E1D3FE|nr:uncharacterized protein si:ch211-243a20.4 [Centropristis striata]